MILPWQEMIYYGLVVCKLPPEQFWQLTIPELLVMMQSPRDEQALGRFELQELMKEFPD
jgi:uncharacterized phage protein (TIGR02216 family)